MHQAVSFIDEFRRSIKEAVQNTERGQILEMLRTAVRIRVDPVLTRRVHETVSDTPHLIEQNLDVIRLPALPATWIEIDDRARRPHADGGDAAPLTARIGFLVSPHPSDPGVLVAAIARQVPERVDGACHLMPAFCAINFASLSELSFGARRYLSRVPSESIGRMVMHLRTYVPPGFTPELDAFAKVVKTVDSDRLHTESRLEAAGEGVFLLALLVALNARNVLTTVLPDGGRLATMMPAEPGMKRNIMAALRLAPRPSGIVRDYEGRMPVVSLLGDAAA